MTQAFPLQWPTGRPRTKTRRDSAFSVTPNQAYTEMMNELSRFRATSIVVSSNIPLRRDGTPYREGLDDRLQDPGIAVYFTKGGRLMCLPCDTYLQPWENCRAIGNAVEALRSMERHGAHQILDQAYQGFMALPDPAAAGTPGHGWWTVLGVPPTATAGMINAAWKEKCREAGGATIELNAARDQGLAAAQG